MTNLTPAQLEQFESTFRYFDKDESNTLSVSELAAALASLGIVYSVSIWILSISLRNEKGSYSLVAVTHCVRGKFA